MRDLLRRHTSVGIHHDDDVAARSGETGSQRAALARAALLHDGDVRPAASCGDERCVGGVSVDEDDFVDALGDLIQYPSDVARLVANGDDQTDRVCRQSAISLEMWIRVKESAVRI